MAKPKHSHVPSVLSLYNRLAARAAGRWLFSRLVCLQAPYFASIRPRIESRGPGRGVAILRHRRAVTSPIGSVHAIALCNLAEFTGGLTTDVSIPPSMRWIPIGIVVEYLGKAMGTMRAVAMPEFEPAAADAAYELPVQVVVSDARDEPVFRTRIAMRVSPRGTPLVRTHHRRHRASATAARSTPAVPARPARRRCAC